MAGFFFAFLLFLAYGFNQVDKAADCKVEGTLTNAQKEDALYWHNKARRERAKDGQCANMLEMIWNDQVAAVARNYVPSCTMGHNANRHNDFLGCSDQDSSECVTSSYCLGENFAAGGGTCDDGVEASDNGVCTTNCDPDQYCSFKNMIYEGWVNSEGTATDCFAVGGGHCTQVVWQNSDQLGCGYNDCRSSSNMFVLVCNYLPAGNFNGNDQCVAGDACSDCPDTHPHCNDGLCSRFASSGAGGLQALLFCLLFAVFSL